MAELSPTMVVILMFGALVAVMISGYPIFIALTAIGVVFGMLFVGIPIFTMVRMRILDMLINYTFLAVPLFVFMGSMLEKTGAANKLYEGLNMWLGGFKGGLAIVTLLMGVILAACVGVVAASITMVALIAIPEMLKLNYNRDLICGVTCAGGTLGILIPPSIMLILYGPMAQISSGQLLMGAVGPGFLLGILYIVFTVIRCQFNPKLAPPMPREERAIIPLRKKVSALMLGAVPPLFMMLAVLGSIFFGIATPTEAAAVGCVAALGLAIINRRLSWQALNDSATVTIRVSAMALAIGMGAFTFTGVFLKLGGGDAVASLILSAPGGKWGVFFLIQFIVFILGFFIDWLGILFIIVPLITPIGVTLGFDPLWFAIMVCVNLQMAFLTPPFATSIFYLKGLAPPEWGIDINHIIRGVVPYVMLIMVGLGLCVAFPQIILWLPHLMIKM